MKIFCAWCMTPMGTKEPYEDTHHTHGICAQCAEEALRRGGIARRIDPEEKQERSPRDIIVRVRRALAPHIETDRELVQKVPQDRRHR